MNKKDDAASGSGAWSALGFNTNQKTTMAIAVIIAAGIVMGIWLRSDGGPGSSSSSSTSSAQKGARSDIPMAELLAPGALPDTVIGSKDAKVTIVEYASMTCPHCASFHKTVYPELKKKYVEDGKVRFVFREFPLDDRAAAASMVARCAGPDKTAAMISTLFERQDSWAFIKGSPVGELQKLAKQAGMTEDVFKACVADDKLLKNITTIRDKASSDFGVTSTPTFFINGKKFQGNQDIASFEKALEPLLQ